MTDAGTSHYIHNADDQIIADLDGAGNTLREYIYMNDLPVAVIEGGTNLFWVHSDHLNRPATNEGSDERKPGLFSPGIVFLLPCEA